MYKVRFNLGKGKRYMTWKIEDVKAKSSIYLEPDEVSLTLINCTLKNHPNIAKRIYDGGNKRVCAWVLCENVIVDTPKEVNGDQIRYNPRVTPNWTHKENNVDNKTYPILKTIGKALVLELN